MSDEIAGFHSKYWLGTDLSLRTAGNRRAGAGNGGEGNAKLSFFLC
jgi:hypothetical protein